MLFKACFQAGDPSRRWATPFDLSVRQPANTGVVDWGACIYALFERDLPYRLDAGLHTQGQAKHSVWGSRDVVAAHYRIREEGSGERRLVTLSPRIWLFDTIAKIVEIDEAGKKVRSCTSA
jgi:all-trans-8'-apo-beta-carotenal 15,15'-oxygenase